ncbi:MAG TPA: hypothetical protein VHP34_00600 [Alphaproteobacteria bacterium]|nr:hypothetical protein [Alphaproteobacteria bacterium]
MFRKFVEWVMDKPKEWLSKPRLIPDQYHDIPDGDPRFVMSQEFADKEHNNLRYYLAAIKERPEDDYWQMTLISRDLKHGDSYFETSRRRMADSAEEVIYYLREFERSCHEKEYPAIENAAGTYRKFANLYGLHFDVKGNPFRMEVNEKLDKDTFLSRESLDKIFKHAADKRKPLDNWEQLYAQIIDVNPVEGVTVADLAKDPAWAAFSNESAKMVEKLKNLGDYLTGSKPEGYKNRTLENMIDYVIVDATKFETSAKMKLAQHLIDTTVMVGLLRAGVAVYDKAFTGSDFSPEALGFVAKVGDACSRFAQIHFGLSEADAKPLETIITTGADPAGDTLPLEKILAENAVPVKKPANDTGNLPKPTTAGKNSGPAA